SDAHFRSSIFGCSCNVICKAGQLLLGTWQGIYFCEFDGPRDRKFYISFIADNC
ncbi:MAG: YjbQ family protein, partial [Candidatus Cloacimonetes bacterium]|nr:YjbQ family protein [Candidatus Cloacimonadota bacterium]